MSSWLGGLLSGAELVTLISPTVNGWNKFFDTGSEGVSAADWDLKSYFKSLFGCTDSEEDDASSSVTSPPKNVFLYFFFLANSLD